MTDWSVKNLLGEGRKILAEGKIDNPGLETELLLGYVLNLSRTRVILNRDLTVEKEKADFYWSLIKRKLTHEPTAYILGEKEFFGRIFKVNPTVLIPRPETEELVEWIISKHKSATSLLDLCCGSGCIGITLACEINVENLYLSDISIRAIQTALENTILIKNKTNIREFKGNLFEPVEYSEFDIIVVNPPYIISEEYEALDVNVKSFEPREALELKSPGVFNQTLAVQAFKHLISGGYLYIETSTTLISSWPGILARSGFINIKTKRDISGKERFVRAEKPDNNLML